MHFIVFDLEATCWPDGQHRQESEIIEIGALRVDPYGDVQGTFSRFVQPVVHPHLSPFCTELTGIRQEQVARAGRFGQVIEDFRDWGDIYDDEDYLLCSWGDFDRVKLIEDCRYHNLEDDWTDHHINLKQQYQEIKGLPKPRGLRRSVEKEGFTFEGDHHRALDDAINLVKLFRKYLDEWRY